MKPEKYTGHPDDELWMPFGDTETNMTIKQLSTIVDICNWLNQQVYFSQGRTDSLEQFALDWIEIETDHAHQYLESREITVDDATFTGAIHYRADCVLEVLREDANCYEFFTELKRLTA